MNWHIWQQCNAMVHQGRINSEEGILKMITWEVKCRIGNLKKVYVALLLTEPFVVVFLILFLGTLLQADPCLCSLLIHTLNRSRVFNLRLYEKKNV